MAKSEQKKQAALAALMESSSLTEAADKAGISRRTLYGYIHEDIDFARAYKQIQEEATIIRLDSMEQSRERASSVLLELMEDKTQPGAVRLKAAQAFMEAERAQGENVRTITKQNILRNKDLLDMTRDF